MTAIGYSDLLPSFAGRSSWLGRCIDALFDADVSALSQVITAQVVDQLGLKNTALHLDITSFHVNGVYDCADGDQVGLPVYMQALSGYSNDTKTFALTARRHLSSLKAAQENRYLVGDATLYCSDTLQLLEQQQQLFVAWAPVTLNEAKQAIATISAGY